KDILISNLQVSYVYTLQDLLILDIQAVDIIERDISSDISTSEINDRDFEIIVSLVFSS
ncbi:14083_t:CDS:1, partial [Racocetra fulgida]